MAIGLWERSDMIRTYDVKLQIQIDDAEVSKTIDFEGAIPAYIRTELGWAYESFDKLDILSIDEVKE